MIGPVTLVRLTTIAIVATISAHRFPDDLVLVLAAALTVAVGCCLDYFIWAIALSELRGNGTRATMAPTTRQELAKEGKDFCAY